MDAKVTYHGMHDRDSRYMAEAGPVRAFGKSKAAALKALADAILEALTRLDDEPVFARDDDGSVIAAVSTPHGVTHWRLTDNGVRAITFTDGPPMKSLETVDHYQVLSAR
jgi:hypothetical protein